MWPHNWRRAAKQHLGFGQRLAHQRELAVFEVLQPAMAMDAPSDGEHIRLR